ncbi:MAG: GNAT family N-acetyltransferase [Clostridiales bacterium]|nr:GNAT family N-acetyltransferase [Clostridiales bacterium]
MYEYYKGLVIREGTGGVDGARLRKLYEAVGWCGSSLPLWQNEKFEIAMKNSAWAFTVWDGEELVGMVRVVSDRVMVASIQDLILLDEYRRMGLGRKLVEKCLAKLPSGNWTARTTPENYSFYEKCGFSMPRENNATMEYDGYRLSRATRGKEDH